MRWPCVVTLLMSMSASAAHGSSLSIEWDACGPEGGSNKTFACESNQGLATFLVSFIPYDGMDPISGCTCRVEFWPAASAGYPDWWRLENSGCRQSALGVSVNAEADTGSCHAFVGGSVLSADWDPHPYMYGLVVTTSYTEFQSLDGAREYLVLRVALSYDKTVGASACPGCTSYMLISAAQLHFETTGGSYVEFMPSEVRQGSITWQGPNVPVRATSWGEIKGLYR